MLIVLRLPLHHHSFHDKCTRVASITRVFQLEWHSDYILLGFFLLLLDLELPLLFPLSLPFTLFFSLFFSIEFLFKGLLPSFGLLADFLLLL